MCISSATIDWVATGAMLQAWGTIGGAVAILAATRMGFDVWKRQKQAEARRDEAKAILSASYRARRALLGFRSALMTGGELARAEKELAEDPNWANGKTQEERKRIKTAQAYLFRYRSTREEQDALEACLPMAKEMFDPELEDAVHTLHHQFWSVWVWVEAYVDDWNGTDKDWTKKIRLALFANEKSEKIDEADEVSLDIRRSISMIEQKCSPALRLEDK